YQQKTIPAPEREEIAAQSEQLIQEILARRASGTGEGAGGQPPPGARQPRQPETGATAPPPRSFGLLGVGLEVQAAIAALWLARRGLHTAGPARWQEVRRVGEERFREVSTSLRQDRGMRSLFKWEETSGQRGRRLVRRDSAKGEIVTAGAPFRSWLRDQI